MSITTDEIAQTVTRYLAQRPEETEHLTSLTGALERGTDLISRKTFVDGHVTCGAVVIDDIGRLLLIRHKALGRWLLPGGHLEPTDSTLIHAALRELEEETGISWQETITLPGQEATPIDIDLHLIPANPVKNEPEHHHADFRWAFRAHSANVVLQAEEVESHAWRPISDAPTPRLARKLASL